jgi:hypothetical protein
MKQIKVLAISLALVTALVVAALPAMAAKPPDIILKSNGFPSGLHFNLNIHGKNESFECTNISGGGSIFIDEYGPATIQYTINKKSSLETLEVIEGCAIDDGTAKIQLPWKIRDDDGNLHDADGYYAYARIRGKPQHGQPKDGSEPSSIVVGKHRVVSAGDVLNPDGETLLLSLGLFTSNRLYLPEGNVFERWEDPNAKGKGKAKAQNITPLFMWSGWIVEQDLGTTSSLDIGISNGSCTPGSDGVIDDCDVPGDAKAQIIAATGDPDGWEYYNDNFGTNDSMDDPNDIDQIEEWLAFQADENPHLVTYVEDWIWNIAQLVVTEQDVFNDGSKLLQMRFYPVSTTEFTEKAHIVVRKDVEPNSDLTTEFDFTLTHPDTTQTLFSLRNNQSTLFGEIEELVPGIYTVTETVPSGWQLDPLAVPDDISDPTGDSIPITDGAEIHLAAGETVIVTFTNRSASLEILKEDELGNPLAGSTFTITPDPRTGAGSLMVVDNGSNDADPYPGVLLVTSCLTSETELYTVHEQVPPDGFVGAADQFTTIPSITKVSLTFINTEILVP